MMNENTKARLIDVTCAKSEPIGLYKKRLNK